MIRLNRSPVRLLVVSVVLGVTFGAASFSFAGAPACEDVFRSGFGRDWLPASFSTDKANFIGVTHLSPILDQGQMGFCWLYGTTANLLNRAQQRTGERPDVAIHYWSYYHFLGRALQAVDNPHMKSVAEGGWMETAIDLVRKYGVVSGEQWKALGGSTTLQLPDNSMLEHPQLKALLGRLQLDQMTMANWLTGRIAAREMKEERVRLEKILIEKSRGEDAWPPALVAKLRKTLQSGETATVAISSDTIKEVGERMKNDAHAAMIRFFNQMYFGRDDNPVEKTINVEEAKAKGRALFPEIQEPVVTFMITNDRRQVPRIERDSGLEVVAISMSEAAQLAKAFIASDTPVILAYDHQGGFVDVVDKQDPERAGLMSVRRREQWPVSTYVDRRDRMKSVLGYTWGGHIVNIVGAWLNPSASPEQIARGDETLSFRIQNSWGETPGQKGFFSMDRDYFGAYGAALSVFTHDLEKPEVARLLGPELIEKIKAHLANH